MKQPVLAVETTVLSDNTGLISDQPLHAAPALCVDLDGTLIKTDLLIESMFAYLKRHPWAVFLIPLWVWRGKAYLKARIAAEVEIEAQSLPYDLRLLECLRWHKAQGRTLVLATASHRKFATAIAAHLCLFDEVYATENNINLSSTHKRDCLVRRFGAKGFDYVGNGKADLPVWAAARYAWLVDTRPPIHKAAAKIAIITAEFQSHSPYFSALLKELRVHQWLKNILIWVPLIAAHKIADPALVRNALWAFLAYSLCASSVYLLNDLLDLPADRMHPRKRFRAFAAGTVPVSHGLLYLPLLLCLAGLISVFFLTPAFIVTLAVYYCVTILYSFWAKQRVGVDILFLAGLYTLRLIAGAAATHIALSFWLLAFSMFLFFSLALVKRYAEMLIVSEAGKHIASGRGYAVRDMPLLESMGISAGYLAVLVLALYINSSDVSQQYEHPMALWVLCPSLLFWLSRVWIKTHRGEMHDDPVVFATKDRLSLAMGVIAIGVIWMGV